MALTRIILWVGNTLIFCAVLFAITALVAFALVEFEYSVKFGAAALSTGVIGSVFAITTYNTSQRETNLDALIYLILFWICIPFVTAIPFLFSDITTEWGTAYFESVSAITTTGASSLSPDLLPKSILFWRSLLQGFGGVCAATFAVVILATLNLSGTGVHRSILFTYKTGDLFPRLIAIAKIVSGVYGGISFICFIGLIISGTPVFDSLCLALSAISTGGLTPRSELLHSYVNPFGILILAMTCLMGAASIAVIWDAIRIRSWRTLVRMVKNIEHRALGVVGLILFILGLVFVGFQQAPTLFIESIFFVSSSGFDYHVIGLEMLPPAVLITIALIGGSALSTAGGVKIIRLLLLLRHVGTDLNRLTHPSRIVPVRFRGQILPDKAFLSVWMYFFAYTMVFGVSILALGVTGLKFETATASAAAALSNMGPLLDYTLPEKSYAEMSSLQHLLLASIMLIGRIEVLAALALLSPTIWRR